MSQQSSLPEESSNPNNRNDDVAIHVQDGPLVGTPALLSSPRVVDPSSTKEDQRNNHVVMMIPTPSIYRDGRGEIHNVLLDDRHRINVLHTRRGVMRSGDLHPNRQCDFVVWGRVEVWTLQSPDGGTRKTEYGPREYIEIPPYVPHVFVFLEDTVMAEWWEENNEEEATTSDAFRAWFYTPYRQIVDGSFDSKGIKGKLNVFHCRDSGNSVDYKSRYLSWLVGGIALGVAMGLTLCRQSR